MALPLRQVAAHQAAVRFFVAAFQGEDQGPLGLQRGERVLIHCAGGIGRTGTLAACNTRSATLPWVQRLMPL